MKMTEHKERFEEKVCPEPNTGCHLWTAAVHPRGYGTFYLKGKVEYSHRVAYELYVATIPEGLHVCHTCDVPGCVNPEHLFLGTHTDNMRDKVAKGRQYKPQGSDNGFAKLTEAEALEVYHAEGTCQAIADEYGICQKTVSRIKNKQIWSHIHD
jgi:hypothetical protein